MIYINNLSEKPDFKIFYVLSTVKLVHKEHTWGLKECSLCPNVALVVVKQGYARF